MNKRGQLESPFLWVAGLVFLMVIAVFLILIVRNGAYNKGLDEILSEEDVVGDHMFLVDLLRRDGVSELIVESYLSGDYDLLKTRIDDEMAAVFEEDVCWKLFLDDVEIRDTDDCTWLEKTYNGKIVGVVYLPYERGVIRVAFGERNWIESVVS